MTNIQYMILISFLVLVICVFSYYIYQDYRFKRLINNSFYPSKQEVLDEQNDFVFDTLNIEANTTNDNIFVEDSVENKFSTYDNVTNPFESCIDKTLDYIIDIVFDDAISIKPIIDISHYLNDKKYYIYLLDEDNNWHMYNNRIKIKIKAIKYVINFVDSNGIITNIQVTNLYKELYKFVLSHNGYIRQSNYSELFNQINSKLKSLKHAQSKIDLFLLFKNEVDTVQLIPQFEMFGFVYKNNSFYYHLDNLILAKITIDNEDKLSQVYTKLLKVSINFELSTNPQLLLDKILDMYEHLAQTCDVRLLTTNKTVFADNEYNLLRQHLTKFSENVEKLGFKTGDNLIVRVFGKYF